MWSQTLPWNFQISHFRQLHFVVLVLKSSSFMHYIWKSHFTWHVTVMFRAQRLRQSVFFWSLSSSCPKSIKERKEMNVCSFQGKEKKGTGRARGCRKTCAQRIPAKKHSDWRKPLKNQFMGRASQYRLMTKRHNLDRNQIVRSEQSGVLDLRIPPLLEMCPE